MPKGRKVAAVDRVRWLDEHYRGATIIEIAQRDNRSQRTVTGQIARARQEREQKEVRTGLLRDAYQKHYEDLGAVAEGISDEALGMRDGTLLANIQGRAALLQGGLREHLPGSPLWKACGDWEYYAKQYFRGLEELRVEIDGAVEEDPATQRDTFMASLDFAARETVQGGNLDHMKYERSTTLNGYGLNWGLFTLSDAASNSREIDRLVEKHKALVRQITSSEVARNLADTHGKWEEARLAIRNEVDVLVLRRIILGQCKLCPQ